MFTIVRREEMAGGTVLLNEVEAPLIADKALPGQFVIVKANETGERVPLTIADSDPAAGTILIIYMVIGKSTRLFADLQTGDAFQDVIGPLGKASHIENVGRAVCVGGGTGIAALHFITKGLKQAGNRVTCIIGARTRDLLIMETEMRAASHDLTICTDDGSYGRKGFVTEALQEVLDSEPVDLVVGIGPVPMMKAVADLTREYGTKTLVSLNPIMIDGTGMCGGCRVSVGGTTRFACVDGPDFDGHKVDFDMLMMRLAAYREDESKSTRHYCNVKQQEVIGPA
jgi:ferredoxin--NADP+ reductase